MVHAKRLICLPLTAALLITGILTVGASITHVLLWNTRAIATLELQLLVAGRKKMTCNTNKLVFSGACKPEVAVSDINRGTLAAA